MDTSSAPNLWQAVRAHFGVGFGPMATWLGVSEALLAQAAIGRRDLPGVAYQRLRPLAEALPPPWNLAKLPDPDPAATSPAPPAAGLLPPLPQPADATALRARLATCQHGLLAGARALAPLVRRQAQARRLAAVLPALAAFAAGPLAAAHAGQVLPALAAQAAERLGPAATAQLALAQARHHALALEAAQLHAWLEA